MHIFETQIFETHIFVILNTKWKDCKSRKNLCTENFTCTRKFYVHEIVDVNLSKNYFLKNTKKNIWTKQPRFKSQLNKDFFLRSLFKVNDKKLERIICELLTLSKYFTCSLIATFCFAHVQHFWTCLEGI